MKKRGLVIIMLTIMLTLFGCDSLNEKKGETYTWSNPVSYFENQKGLRDPFILKVGDTWYLTGTAAPYVMASENAQNIKTPGVLLYKSTDLSTWDYVGCMVDSPTSSEKNKWYQDRFWAPEIFYHNGLFYITVNCCALDGSNHGMLFAVSENIEGPYEIMNEESPAFYGNDAHLFVNDDGKIYLYASGIWAAEIDLTTLQLKSEVKSPVTPVVGSTAWNGYRGNVGIEGPYVIKRNNKYFMFYSTWSRGYEVGVATADDPLNNWVMDENPLYGSMNQTSCNYFGGIYEDYYTNQDKYKEVGHNSVFLGPDGGDWIVAHCFDYESDVVKYTMDKLSFNEDNSVSIVNINNSEELIGPSFGKQTLKFEEIKNPSVVKALDVWAYVKVNSEYILPSMVDVLFDNGWRDCADVVWKSGVDTSTAREQIIKGTVSYSGGTYEVNAKISVE